MKAKNISQEIAKGQQSVTFKEVVEWEGFKIKTEIKSDSYDFQCFASISVWKNLEWSKVHSIHHGAMRTRSKLVYGTPNKADFAADATELFRVAKQILK